MKKKTDVKIIIMFILIGIVLFGFLIYKVKKDFFTSNNEHKQIDSIGFYSYTLSERDTGIYKSNFKELTKVLNEKPINYIEYAKTISKLFIIDLYTLDNKLGSTDIGGLEFIHKDLKENFKENMGASLYKFIENNLNNDRTQELPIVKEVTINDITETKYTYKDVEYDAYLVNVKWIYEKDLGYQTSIKLTIIKDNGILYIVKGEEHNL